MSASPKNERRIPAREWEQGKEFELHFWDHWLSTGGDRWPDEFRERVSPDTALQDYLSACLDPEAQAIRILDVGAGPLTIVGKRLPDRPLEVIAVDALAEEYDEMLSRHGINPAVRTEKLHSEDLLKRFDPGTFDLVHIRNSLDHCYDPLSVLWQSLALLKPGCCLVLNHEANEGEQAGYAGFHRWNLTVEREDLILWNLKTRVSVKDEFGALASLETKASPDAEYWDLVVIRKLTEQVPIREDRLDAGKATPPD